MADLPNGGATARAELELGLRALAAMDPDAGRPSPLGIWLAWAAEYAAQLEDRRFFQGLLAEPVPEPRGSQASAANTQTERAALIVTALALEFAAVTAHLAAVEEFEGPDGTIYESGRFGGMYGDWRVTVLETGAGNVRAATAVSRAVDFLEPELVIMVGVAGGLKDVQLGDVVVAERVYWVESGKETESGLLPRPVVLESSHRILERARACRRREDWRTRVPGDAGASAVHIGPVAADEKVLASPASVTAKLIKANYGDALAVEMESAGVFRALAPFPYIERLAVRGISDLVAGKAESDASGWQPRAAGRAAAFTFEDLGRFGGPETTESTESSTTAAPPAPGLPDIRIVCRSVTVVRPGERLEGLQVDVQNHDLVPVFLESVEFEGQGKPVLVRDALLGPLPVGRRLEPGDAERRLFAREHLEEALREVKLDRVVARDRIGRRFEGSAEELQGALRLLGLGLTAR